MSIPRSEGEKSLTNKTSKHFNLIIPSPFAYKQTKAKYKTNYCTNIHYFENLSRGLMILFIEKYGYSYFFITESLIYSKKLLYFLFVFMIMNEEKINQIWDKGRPVDGVDSSKFRKDACGAWIARNKFGNRDSDFGWDIDYIYPQSMGGDKNPENLRPLNIQNIVSKADSYPSYISCFTSKGQDNIRKLQTKVVNRKKQEKLKSIYGTKK